MSTPAFRSMRWGALGMLLAMAAALPQALAAGAEPVVGMPCEGCEWVFVKQPSQMTASVRIASPDEPGEPLRLEGVVRGADGQPRAGIIVYAYHTDAKGLYPAGEGLGPAARHGRLRAWAMSDAEGRYRFDTIRPAGYPGTRIAQHIHLHVIEPGRCTYYIDDVHFTDDPRWQPQDHARQAGRGGNGVVTPTKAATGWLAVRDIALGRNVPGYHRCGSP